ncbi:MAG: hypothetical protein FWF66_06810 [Candidatus Bathyarchaeota archaeon]|nr:hypothetical protein [Candidatus Termiticorpusculum sp.]MCL1971143.1 hypothetical protein [Candidatus Termiticorpusculum sp.]
MTLSIKIGKKWAIYSLCIGLASMIFGLLGLTSGLSLAYGVNWSEWGISTVFVYPDIFTGVMMAIIGVIFLLGVRPQWSGKQDAVSFLVVGTLLSALFFGVYLAMMGANAIGYSMYNAIPAGSVYANSVADWEGWIWLNDVHPGIWLFVFVIPGLYLTLKLWRKE